MELKDLWGLVVGWALKKILDISWPYAERGGRYIYRRWIDQRRVPVQHLATAHVRRTQRRKRGIGRK